MSSVHGKDTYMTVDAKNITAFLKTSNWEAESGIHDYSGSGTDDTNFRGGQNKRTLTIGGWYDSSLTTGPGYLETKLGATVPVVRRIQGTGTGKPEQQFNAVVGKYVESQKNDDIVQWTCDLTIDGAVTASLQA